MVQSLRERIIDEGISKNIKVEAINKKLAKYNQAPYNPLTYGKNYTNIGGNILRNAQEMGEGLRTIGGAIAKPIVDTSNKIYHSKDKLRAVKEAFNEARNNPTLKNIIKYGGAGATAGLAFEGLGAIPGAILGGVVGASGGPENFANSILSTYNLTLDDISKGNIDWRDVAQGALRNPLYTAMDVSPVGGKVLKGGVSKVGNVVTKDSPLWLQQILPSKELRQFNRQLTEGLVSSKARQAERYGGYNTLSSSPLVNREELVRHVAYNNSNLKGNELKIADAIKKDLITNEKQAIKMGLLDKQYAKDNTVAQYVMGNIQDKSNLLNMDIMDIIQGRPLRQVAIDDIASNKLDKQISQLVKKGSDLYDEGKITFLTQKIASETDPLQNILASEINRGAKDYFDTSRVIGRASIERLGKAFDDSIKFQLDQVSKSSEALDTLNDILNNKEVTGMLGSKSKKDISNKFIKSIQEDIANGNMPDINRALKDSRLTSQIDKIYSEALNNAFKAPITSPYRKYLNAFKKAVLANPHWIALNRIGNWTNNAMEGVRLEDYIDRWGKYKKLIPKQLEQQTSFSSYVNEGIEGMPKVGMSTMLQPINTMVRDVGKFSLSNKSLTDIGRLGANLYSSFSDVTANPLFRAEAALELTDRYANYIRQAKRLSQRTGESVESILKKSNTDRNLFNTLNTEVNKSLGDYLGKNYAIPSQVYDILGETVPFYRFLTQTGRTTAHQLTNRPLAFASSVSLPARAGADMYRDILNQYELDPEKYKGGVPYSEEDGNIRTLGYEPLPAGAVGEQLAGFIKGEDLGILSPLLTTIPDIIHYEKNGRQPTSPGSIRAKLRGEKDYKPTQAERIQYALNTLLQTTSNPYILSTRYVPELRAVANQQGLQSMFDTGPYLVRDKDGNIVNVRNPLSFKRLTPDELIGRWIGLQTASNYKQKAKSKSQIKKEARNAKWNRKQLIKNVNRKLGD